jgi:hypothetical protein
MNERWTRGVRHALLFLLVPVLSACAVGRLSDRIVIDVATRVTAEDGNGDLLLASDLNQEAKIKLQPGDVLTYTRWSPGMTNADEAVSAQTHEPSSDQFSLALRFISPTGRLSSEEARFLGTVLTTHRTDWSDTRLVSEPGETIGDLQSIIERNQVKLWNNLVEEISLSRLERPFRPNEAAKSKLLIVSISMQALCEALEDKQKDAKLFAQTFIDPGRDGCTPSSEAAKKTTELTNPPELLLSPLYAATSASVKANDRHFYFVHGPGSYAQFNFTEIERNGVRVDRREGPEARWTLREWQDAGICKIRGDEKSVGELVIRRIRLIGGRRKIWINHGSEEDYQKTYHLKTRLTKETASRWIERISKEGTFADRAVLDQSALDVLRMSDLDFVEWGPKLVRKGHRREAVDVRPNGCRFLDADN